MKRYIPHMDDRINGYPNPLEAVKIVKKEKNIAM